MQNAEWETNQDQTEDEDENPPSLGASARQAEDENENELRGGGPLRLELKTMGTERTRSLPRRRTRWIVIGTIREPWYVKVANCGYPGGILMDWRGRVDAVFQPIEFLDWRHLLGVVDARLGMARLERVSVAVGTRWWLGLCGVRELLVEVRRRGSVGERGSVERGRTGV